MSFGTLVAFPASTVTPASTVASTSASFTLAANLPPKMPDSDGDGDGNDDSYDNCLHVHCPFSFLWVKLPITSCSPLDTLT